MHLSKIKFLTASGHDIFTQGAKLNQHSTIKISANFMQKNKHEKHFTQSLLETRLICTEPTTQVLVIKF